MRNDEGEHIYAKPQHDVDVLWRRILDEARGEEKKSSWNMFVAFSEK